jgi:isoquinoline 1-oxidoreductase beta subunit
MSENSTPNQTRRGISRRQFLTGLGIGAGALVVGAVIGAPTIVREVRLVINQAFLTGEAPLGELPDTPMVWFRIDPDNSAHLYIPKIEMGQGIHTTLAQIAADELELDWNTVVVHQADTETGFDPGLIFTFGSTSTTALYKPIREAAATMRTMLRTEAAAQLGVTMAEISAESSACFVTASPDSRLSYGQVVAAKQGDWVLPEGEPALKSADQFRFIGKSVQRVDFKSKLTGKAIYGYDVRVEGMVYGAIARAPRYGATLARAAAGSAGDQPGVVQVVIDLETSFAGIIAQTRSQAYAALAFLDLEWQGGTTMGDAEIREFMTVPAEGGTLIQREGDLDAAITRGTLVTAEYRTPMAAHAHLEAQAGLAHVTADGITIYASTQSPGLTRDFIATALGVEANTITVIPTYVGGGFGRKTGTDAAVEAAILSRASGYPVHVGWTREEDMRYGYRRPPTHHMLKATLDEQGKILAFEHQLASSDVFFYIQNLNGSTFLETLLGADPLAAYGSLIHYAVPNRRVIYHHRRLPVPTAFWRGLGSFPNTFAMETFVDELAHQAGVDALDLRLNHLPEGDLGARYRVALETVAEASNWRTPAPEGRARGLATAYDRGTVVALVVEISYEAQQIRVHHAWCAVDPGLVVNPDGAAAQVQGSIIMALSSTLYEKISVTDGMITNENFHLYPLLTMRDTPAIDVLTINSSDTPVGGMGEPVVGTVPAAVGNALFALTGERRRELPLV